MVFAADGNQQVASLSCGVVQHKGSTGTLKEESFSVKCYPHSAILESQTGMRCDENRNNLCQKPVSQGLHQLLYARCSLNLEMLL